MTPRLSSHAGFLRAFSQELSPGWGGIACFYAVEVPHGSLCSAPWTCLGIFPGRAPQPRKDEVVKVAASAQWQKKPP